MVLLIRLMIPLGPFVETSNGWIGAWGGLIATARWSIGLKDSWYKDRPEGLKQMINIAACSLILLFASIPPIIHKWENYGGAGLSVAGSVITLITCAYLALMYSDFPRNLMKITVLLLLVLWVCVAGVCTFHGPFLVTSEYPMFELHLLYDEPLQLILNLILFLSKRAANGYFAG